MILRKCTDCGIEATSEDELVSFAKNKRGLFGRENCCYTCKRIRFLSKNPNYRKEYHIKNKEKENKNSTNWLKNNGTKALSICRKYQASKKQAIPKWYDKDTVELIYETAKMFGCEVDHIIPLQHNLVCGLHVQDNLQFLTSRENKMKSNKLEWKRTA